jgi:hypothetical protein
MILLLIMLLLPIARGASQHRPSHSTLHNLNPNPSDVAQTCSLLYRRFATCSPLQLTTDN